jgi:hypothetical protein
MKNYVCVTSWNYIRRQIWVTEVCWAGKLMQITKHRATPTKCTTLLYRIYNKNITANNMFRPSSAHLQSVHNNYMYKT